MGSCAKVLSRECLAGSVTRPVAWRGVSISGGRPETGTLGHRVGDFDPARPGRRGGKEGAEPKQHMLQGLVHSRPRILVQVSPAAKPDYRGSVHGPRRKCGEERRQIATLPTCPPQSTDSGGKRREGKRKIPAVSLGKGGNHRRGDGRGDGGASVDCPKEREERGEGRQSSEKR